MRVGPLRIGRVSEEELHELCREHMGADVTYGPKGSTLNRRDAGHAFTIDLGSAGGTFDAARAALESWDAHPAIGASVFPPDAPIEVGSTVLVELGFGPVHVIVPDRIVAVVDEPDRFGFAYGTLPGHPECGEESFLVDRTAGGSVIVTVRVLAEPALRPRCILGPPLDLLQSAAARGYLQGIRRSVARRVSEV